MKNNCIRRLPTILIGVFVMGSALQGAERGVGEVSAFGGMVSVRHGGGTHGNLGGTMGVNLGRFVHLFGEVNYMGVGKEPAASAITTGSGRLMNYGGGVQIRIPTGGTRIEPYGLLAFGYGQMRGGVSGATSGTDSTHSAYNGVGVGARIFIGRKWGIKPEFRYQTYYGIYLSSSNPFVGLGGVINVTTGLFYQFGKRE